MRKLIALSVAATLAWIAQPALSATVHSRVIELLGVTAEPLLAVEANRWAIVTRLVSEHRTTLFANGISESTFRNALESLRNDQLLAAALVDSFAEITTIVSQSQDRATRAVTPKDGSGSGANSWIGYVAGSNLATGPGSAVAAGTFNLASGQNAFVGAGQSNVASGISSLVLGGFDNQATVIDAMVGAGAGNRATGARSVVVGGGYNLASGQWSFIGGGGRVSGSGAPGTIVEDHIASGSHSTIAGGQGNRAAGNFSLVGGGVRNAASGIFASVGGGQFNVASGVVGTVGGGQENTASSDYSTVGGGIHNSAGSLYSTVSGGALNAATGFASTVAGGWTSTASGSYSTTVGGYHNDAVGDSSVAMGNRAKAWGNGAFAFADSNDFDFASFTDNAFRVRATGGVRFVTGIDANGAMTWSCLATVGTGWGCSSDRNLKENLLELDGLTVLAKVAAMPIYQWQPKGTNAHVKHFGPMAQDFHAAFGLGDDDTMIGMQDADGVALAAIQGLNAKLAEQARELAEERTARQLQARDIAELRSHSASEIATLKRAVEMLLARTSADARIATAR